MSNALFIILIFVLVYVAPVWPHSANWGYAPGGALSVLIIVLIVLALTGRL